MRQGRKTYRIRLIEIQTSANSDVALLTRALGYAMEEKGLREQADDADLELRFSFDMRSVKELNLIPGDDHA